MDTRRLLLTVSNEADPALFAQLRHAGWELHVAPDMKTAERLLREFRFRVGLLMHGQTDEAFCARADAFLRVHDELVWVIASCEPHPAEVPAYGDLILDHAFDHHRLPADTGRLLVTLGHAYGNAQLRLRRTQRQYTHDGSPIVGRSQAVANELRQIARIAKVDAPVLISGESGSGKELAAQAIHEASARAGGPFVPVNCGAIQASLIQSELFGHSRGAFTGAVRDRRGFFETANHGTLFLDEIGDLPLDLQINLLRFLQEATITPVGSTQSIHVDVRVVAATNVDIGAAIASGMFREDLFYRLNVLPLQVPPLRERKEDIEPLALHFFDKFAHEKNPRLKGFTQRALVLMQAYDWPGNVRELINCVRRAMVMADGRLIKPKDLGLPEDALHQHREDLTETRTRAERGAIFVSLQHTGRNVTQAAKQLGVSRMTLYRLMAKHGISLHT